jgi:glutamine amidotransferase
MHNGEVADFPLIKRNLQVGLSDEVFNVVQGNTGEFVLQWYRLSLTIFALTDSEWAFALFLSKVCSFNFVTRLA